MAQSSTAQHPLVRTIIGNIFELAARKDMSRTELARRSGRARSGLSFMANGDRGITVPVIDKFATILDTPPWRLLVPYKAAACVHCHGTPPAGYQCRYCAEIGPVPATLEGTAHDATRRAGALRGLPRLS